MKKAKRWRLFAEEIKPFPLRQNVGRALALEEQLRLLKVAVGHLSSKMLAHYSRMRIEAKRKALDALSSGHAADALRGSDGGYDTKNDTKQGGAGEQVPEVIKNMVELVGLEPTTSSLRTMRSPN